MIYLLERFSHFLLFTALSNFTQQFIILFECTPPLNCLPSSSIGSVNTKKRSTHSIAKRVLVIFLSMFKFLINRLCKLNIISSNKNLSFFLSWSKMQLFTRGNLTRNIAAASEIIYYKEAKCYVTCWCKKEMKLTSC